MQPESSEMPIEVRWLFAVLLVAAGVYFGLIRPFLQGLRGQGHVSGFVCIRCHLVGEPTAQTKGHFLIELILWLLFIVPGLIYSIWRRSNLQKICRSCGGPVIDTGSPEGKRLTSGV